jgi:hypothetical protein
VRFLFCALPLLAFLNLAHAEADEWRAGAAATGSVISSTVGGARGTAGGAGGRLTIGYGLTDSLEVGLALDVTYATSVQFAGAALGPQTGNLFGDVFAGEAALYGRWTPGVELVHAFARTQPVVELGAGLVGRRLSNQELLDDQGRFVSSPAPDLALAPLFIAGLGVQHRFGRGLLLAVDANAAASTNGYFRLGGTVELALAWY